MSKCSKPLLYESLTTIIKFTEPNLRIHLTRRLPSIKTVAKSTLLKIDSLIFEKDKTIVNGTIYQIGCCLNLIPGPHQNEDAQIKDAEQFGDLQLVPTRYTHFREVFENVLPSSQLTIQESNGQQTYRSSFTVPQGLRYMNTVILRGHPIRINEFHVAEGVQTIRLPIGIKFTIKKITVDIMHVGKFDPILDSFPDQVELMNSSVFEDTLEENLNGPIVKNAKRLIIKELAPYTRILNIKRLSNLEVDLRYCKTELTQVLGLVQNCVADGRPVGTTYWIGFAFLNEGMKCLNGIRNQMSVRSSTKSSIILSMRDGSILKILLKQDGKRWVLRFKVAADLP
ncbi:hypothetical protein L5515_010397 [Caenorhabditis briggsae]|uniref:Uncharacterized protein n=1 Tax=Caenorhabditis briggsae TaxID=6238 RepID=A0AAE9ERQ2_CAEBR|nr:hypothetical protein L5515_010397 [Caenorhabditis briggsae]